MVSPLLMAINFLLKSVVSKETGVELVGLMDESLPPATLLRDLESLHEIKKTDSTTTIDNKRSSFKMFIELKKFRVKYKLEM